MKAPRFTLEEQRARIDNINAAEQENVRYLRRHRIRDYLPGQGIYYLGDYPKRYSIRPTEYDYGRLQSLADNGVELIQIHEEWNDSVRHLGADKYSTFDPEGLREFISLCHHFGIKIIPYVSSGYFHELDPDFREEFAQSNNHCIDIHFKYRRCSAGSPQWRDYVLPRTFNVLDEYDFDGIYNDWGLDSSYTVRGALKRPGMAEYDPEIEDMLGQIYSEVKRRGGIYKVHCGHNDGVPCIDRVYDYIWIGECVRKLTPGIAKDYPFYVVPCEDKHELKLGDPDYYFAAVIPFLQFPLLTACGRPMDSTGLHEDIPYYKRDGSLGKGIEYLFREAVGEHRKAHPNGPFTYSLWSSIPDDPEEYPRWCRYLKLYRPMVTRDTLAYIELRECASILSPLPERVFASMFVNERTYLVVSNITENDYELVLRDEWIDRVTGGKGRAFTVKPRRIVFLQKA